MATIYLLSKIKTALEPGEQLILEQNLRQEFGEKWRDIGNGSYLVSADPTYVTEDISNKAGISNGSVGEFIVTALSPYYGYGPTANWEWINANG